MTGKVYQKIANRLERSIRAGDYKTMEKLPPERDLAAEVKVSRTTIREALMALEAAKIIRIKDRSGAFVLPLSPEKPMRLAEISTSPGPHEVLQLRRLIEGEAALLVTMNGSNEAISKIGDACSANASVPPDDTPEFHAATRQFHMAVAEGSGNGLFVELLGFLWDQKSGPLWESWYVATRSQKNRQQTLANLTDISDAIASRRPQAAQTAMHRHIDWNIARFLSY